MERRQDGYRMKQPHDYPNRILVAVTGSSPAIVTETVYALVKQKPPFFPTEIRLITTKKGAERAQILLTETGALHQLRADHNVPPIKFNPECIHVVEGADGKVLCDIRSSEDSERVADIIVNVVRDLTQDDNYALHVSIAGGRKTMGFYLGHALSLFGRQQDRLSHVLVSEEHYEKAHDFFYPTRKRKLIHGPDGRTYDARKANVTLADIPFLRSRNYLNKSELKELMEGSASYSELIEYLQRDHPPIRLVLDPSKRMVKAGEKTFRLPPAKFATYWMLAERARRGRPGVFSDTTGLEQFLVDEAKEFVKERYAYQLQLVGEESDKLKRFKETNFNARGEPKGVLTNLPSEQSRINEELVEQLGDGRAKPYLIGPLDEHPIPGWRHRQRHRVGLNLKADEIEVVGEWETQ